ncbi:IclR family transcriptional regulator [Nesterenkonia natronophila]|uniref:IclR family transcriptional regulator n=1 Tax=Nesterenkonia natronophila TaxID=2174932 RepID=A0A3A4F7R9_9MICC|nr:helix-turn-helix domain-containing protein [Nesterenkonia natronophila]RJN32540.1 IclR family transcriptional regulator [Nesterenkonia natronophila]
MTEPSTRTVQRALTLLASVCDRGSTTLAEVAREADLPPSTALRLMRTLETAEFLSRGDDNNYQPGPRLIQLGAKAFSREMLVPLSREPMQEVVAATGESVYLSVPGADETALYISIEEGTFSVRHTNWVGRTVPLEGSAAGKVLRSETPESGYVALENTIEEDVTAISAPISAGGRVVAAMSTLVPTYRLSEQRRSACGEALVRAAGTVSAALGE